MIEKPSGYVREDWFLRLWRAATNACIDYADLSLFGVPAELENDAWESLNALKKNAGVVLPYKLYLPDAMVMCDSLTSTESRDVFYYPTKEIVTSLAVLGEISGPTSACAASLANLDKSSALTYILAFEEALFCLGKDGVEIAHQRARNIWVGSAPVCSWQDRLLANLRNVFFGTAKYATRPVTRGLIEAIQEQLLDDVEGDVPHTSRVPEPGTIIHFDPEETLGIVCELASGRMKDLSPIVAIHSLEGILWDQAPLPSLNYTVSLVLRKICSEKFGFPALAFNDYALSFDAWITGSAALNIEVPSYSSTQQVRISKRGFDASSFYAAVLEIDKANMARLSKTLTRYEKAQDNLGRALDADPRINSRQRATLIALFGSPDRTFTLADYCSIHKVSYTTARNDLSALAAMGFLNLSDACGVLRYQAGPSYTTIAREAMGNARMVPSCPMG